MAGKIDIYDPVLNTYTTIVQDNSSAVEFVDGIAPSVATNGHVADIASVVGGLRTAFPSEPDRLYILDTLQEQNNQIRMWHKTDSVTFGTYADGPLPCGAVATDWTLTFSGSGEYYNWGRSWITNAAIPWPTSIHLTGTFPDATVYNTYGSAVKVAIFGPTTGGGWGGVSNWRSLYGSVDSTSIFTGDIVPVGIYSGPRAEDYALTKDQVTSGNWSDFFLTNTDIAIGSLILVQFYSPSTWTGQVVLTFNGSHADVLVV